MQDEAALGHTGGGEARPACGPLGGVLARGLWAPDPGEEEHEPGPEQPAPLEAGQRPRAPAGRGPRRAVRSERPFRGRYVRAVPAGGQRSDLAWDALLRDPSRRPVKRERMVRPGRLVLFVVDISGSMGTELMGLARRIALSLLQDAYLRRDRVAMIACCGDKAELVFGPTSQAEQVRRTMARLTEQCGGTTPLAAALQLAWQTLEGAAVADAGRRQTLVLISDGRANVGRRAGYQALVDELEQAARALARRRQLRRLFLDATQQGKDDRRARWLAERLLAERVRLWPLGRDGAELARAVGRLMRDG